MAEGLDVEGYGRGFVFEKTFKSQGHIDTAGISSMHHLSFRRCFDLSFYDLFYSLSVMFT